MFLSACILAALPTEPQPATFTPEIPAAARPTFSPGSVFDLSPDGKTVLSSFQLDSHHQFLRFRALDSGAVLNDLPLGTYQQVRSAKFGPDGQTLAVSVGSIRGAHSVRILRT